MENENISSNSINNNNNESNELIPITSPINIFCKNKKEINNQNENGWTPIYRSVLTNNLIVLKELLELGANGNIANNMNETPLYQSVEMENYDAMIILLKYNCDCNICKKNGNSPLHIATKKGKMNFISALLRHGANPNLINKLYNQTPFHIAIIEKLSKDIITLFKNFNADLYNIKDKYDKSPFDYCKENGEDYENMVKNIFCESYQDFQNNLKENNFKQETPKNTSSTIKFPEKFSSSELIAKGGNFDSSKSKSLIIKNDKSRNSKNNISNIHNNNSFSNNNKEVIKGIIEQTIKKINVEGDCSNFQFSTPRDLINNNNNLNNIPEINMFNLDNGISSNKSKKSEKDNIQSNKKDLTSDMNPLDLINQVITTTNNSNIFSELQINTQPDRLNTNNKIDSDEEDSKIENNINEYIPTIGTNDMEYSKSKSYIVSELPQINISKQSKNEVDFSNINIIDNCRKSENINDEEKENKNPNLIHIEENLLEDQNNSNIFNKKSSYTNINTKNNIYVTTTTSNYESNTNNTGNNLNKEIKILNLNPNFSNIYINNYTGTTQRNSSFIQTKINKYIPNKINNDKKQKINNISQRNHTSLFTNNHINGNTTFSTFNSPLYNIHKKKSSLLTEYVYKNNINDSINNDNIDEYPTNEQISKLKDWLISCDLISYLNLLINNKIYEIEEIIDKIKKEELNITFKDIEELGIRKPGHIFRFLLKLQVDCEKIDNKLLNYLLNVCTSSNNIAMSSNNIECICCKINEGSYVTNYNDVISYLESKGLGYLIDNFIHNGFECVDYIIIQIFSKYNFNNEILIDYLHIYNLDDRKKVLNIFKSEKKKICDDLNIPFEDNENYLDVEVVELEKCKMCNIY